MTRASSEKGVRSAQNMGVGRWVASTRWHTVTTGSGGRAVGMSEKGARSAQKMQVGPRTPVGIQLEMAKVGPTSGPTRRLSHLGDGRGGVVGRHDHGRRAHHLVKPAVSPLHVVLKRRNYL